MKTICRICLSECVPMKSIENTGLQEVYQKLTLMSFKCETGRPQSVCVFCVALLRKACRLMETSLRAEQLFAQTLDTGAPINKIQNFAEPPLTLSNVIFENIDLYPKAAPNDLPLGETEECTNVAVKLEEELQISDYEPCDATDKEETVSWTSDIKLSDFTCNGLPTHDKANDHNTEIFQTQNGVFELKKCQIVIEDLYNKQTVERPQPLAETSTNQLNSNMCRTNLINTEVLGHLRKHTGDKPFECGVCHERFAYKSHLTQHMLIHTGEKPYKCEICNKKYAQRAHLKRHIITHTGEKPFECVLCSKRFARNCYLKDHMRTHTGEKPYKCDYCNKNFAKSCSLTRHIKTHT